MKMNWRENSVFFFGHLQAFPMPAKKWKNEGKQGWNTVSTANGLRQKERMGKGESLTFYSMYVLWSGFLFDFMNCKITFKIFKGRKLEKKKKKREKLCQSDLVWWMWFLRQQAARIFQTNQCHSVPKKKKRQLKILAHIPLVLRINFCWGWNVPLHPL